jgi:hypothetical protein
MLTNSFRLPKLHFYPTAFYYNKLFLFILLSNAACIPSFLYCSYAILQILTFVSLNG